MTRSFTTDHVEVKPVVAKAMAGEGVASNATAAFDAAEGTGVVSPRLISTQG